MIGGGWPWTPSPQKIMHCHKCFCDDLCFSCNQSNQVAARRSSRSQNSRPQRGVDRPSCYATAVCGGTAWMMRLPGSALSKFPKQNDKWQTNKSKTWGWYLLSKKKKNRRMVKTLLSQTIFSNKKKHLFPSPPLSVGLSPTSFGGQLKCRFWTCQLGQKLQGRCFTWWVPLSRSLLRGCFGDFNINPTQLCRINPGWRDYFFPIPGDKFGDFHGFFGDNSSINPRFLKDPYHFIPSFHKPRISYPVI